MGEILKENKMGNAPMLKLIIGMSLPSMFSMIIQALYNVVDSMFVALIDQQALTAVSIAFPLQVLLVAVAVGTGIGVNSLVSRRLGEGKTDDANSAASHGIILEFVSWLVFVLLGVFVTVPFFNAYTDNQTIINYGIQYTSTVLIFSLGAFIEIGIEKSLQATGNMVFPMLFQLSGAVINIILDPLLIFGIGPFPQMGVLGAAVATVVGQFGSMIFAIIVLFKKEHVIKVSFKNFKLNFEIIKNIYAVAFPSIIMQSITSILVVCLNSILIAFSEVAVNVLGIYFKLQSFVFMPVFGLTQGVMPIMGYNYGAKNKKRLLSAFKYSVIIAIIIMSLGTLLFWIYPEWLLYLFSATDEVLKIGTPALRIISLHFVIAAVGIMVSTLFQAVGKGVRSLVMSVMRQLVLILPIAYVLSFVGLEYIWYAFFFAEIGSLTCGIIFYINLLKNDFKKLG